MKAYTNQKDMVAAMVAAYDIPEEHIEKLRITGMTMSPNDPVMLSFVHEGQTLGTGTETRIGGFVVDFYGEIIPSRSGNDSIMRMKHTTKLV